MTSPFETPHAAGGPKTQQPPIKIAEALIGDLDIAASYRSGDPDAAFGLKKAGFEPGSLFSDLGEKLGMDLPGPKENFNIDLNFYGENWTPELLNLVASAADFMSEIIATGLPDDTLETPDGTLFIDDIFIEVVLLSELPEGTLPPELAGGAIVTSLRDETPGDGEFGLPTSSLIIIDDTKLPLLEATNTLETAILHELFHAMGYGSVLPDPSGTLDLGIADTPWWGAVYDPAVGVPSIFDFDGATTVAENGGPVPLDGVFSLFAHWDEFVFGDELMTPIIGNLVEGTFGPAYLSDITLAAMVDMGYDIPSLDTSPGDQNVFADGVDLDDVADNSFVYFDDAVIA